MAAPSTDQAEAMPDRNASCAVPTVDLAPMNSDISSTLITVAGRAREAIRNCSDVRLRSFTVSQLVKAM